MCKTVIVTGASSGIGKTIVTLLAEQGYQVIATARSKVDMRKLDLVKNVSAKYLDLTDKKSIVDFVDFCSTLDTVNVLINNAGILVMGPLMAIPEQQLRELFEVNVFGTIELTKAIIPLLVRNQGQIVFISSDNGLVTFPYTVYYSMTKHAIESFADGLYEELKQFEITISLIEPGNIRSQLVNHALEGLKQLDEELEPVFREQLLDALPRIRSAARRIEHSQPPKLVAEAVHSVLQEPVRRKLVTTQSETTYIIDSLSEKLAGINNSGRFGYSKEKLLDRFEFALDTPES